jgi:hypothetical protein
MDAIGIHIGDVTHHQDQLMLFDNFYTKNIKNKIVPNSKLLFLSFSFLYYNIRNFFYFNYSFI